MAIQVKDRIADHLIGSLIRVVVEKGWDYAEIWLKNQGVRAKRINAVPKQLPSNNINNYYEYMNGFYWWHFVDQQRNVHVKWAWTQQGWIGPYQP